MELMKQKTIDDFMTYAVVVIKSRAIPLAEDGLKPVARRILYAMNELKLKPTSPTVKCAKVVGHTIAKLHPSGDASVCDALVRLSQPWKMRYPLTEIEGNNGSLNGDKHAAQRYIETRLSEAGMAMLEGLDPTVLPFKPNFDNTTTEPEVLSGIFPNLLCNGAEGIAVGVSCSLVPHNLNNVIDLIEAHLKNRALTVDEALSIIKGPDFPLGGIIVDGYNLRNIYATGQGSITLRAVAEAEPETNSIKFSEFPYLVDVDRITEKIKSMVLDEDYTDIVNFENHIGRNSCFIRIICQKKANLQKVINDLYEKTPLQKTIKINNTVVHNGVPSVVPLLGLTNIYINHRNNCITRTAKNELKKQQHIIHIQSGLLKATENIDSVIYVIRNSESKEEAKPALQKLLSIDDEQAEAILGLQLGRLSRLDRKDIDGKIANAHKEAEKQQEIIDNYSKRVEIMINDLEKMRKKFGDDRRTTIITKQPEIDQKSNEIEGLIVSCEGESSPFLIQESELGEFKKNGKYGKLKPVCWKWNEGLPHYILNSDGTIAEDVPTENHSIFLFDKSKEYVVSVSRGGTMKKTPIGEYKKLNHICKVRANDEIGWAFCVNADDAIMVFANDKISKIQVKDIKESGKLTIGNKTCAGPLQDAFVATQHYYTYNSDMQMKRAESNEIEHTSLTLNKGCECVGPCSKSFVLTASGFEPINWDKIMVKSRTADGGKYLTKKYVVKICKK